MNPTILLDHDLPGPDGKLVLRALLRVEGQAPEDASRIPLNLSIVLDRSGSMEGAKLQAAREAAALLVRRLRPEDLVSVVAYDDQVVVVAEPGTGDAQKDLPRTLQAIGAGGSTNLSGGWLRGRELVARNRVAEGVSRVLLLTDGLANVGITDPDALAGLCLEAARKGVSTTTVGFGEGFDERLLRAMADAGGGSTYYIERVDQATGIFEEELEGLLSLTAQNVSVEVRVADAVELAAVHHSYPRSSLDGGLRLEMGDLYAREPRVLLLELALRGPLGEETVDVARLALSGDVLLPGGGVERREIDLPIRLSAADGPRVEPVVRRELLLQEAARAREEALERQGQGDYGGAADALRRASSKLREAGIEDAEVAEEASDLEAMSLRVGEGVMADADAKYLFQRAYDVRRSKLEARERYRRGR